MIRAEVDEIGPKTGMAKHVPGPIVQKIYREFSGHDDARFRLAVCRDFVGVMMVTGVPFWLWKEAIEEVETFVLNVDIAPVAEAAVPSLNCGSETLRDVDESFLEIDRGMAVSATGICRTDSVLAAIRLSLAGMLYETAFAWIVDFH